jgi:hypothetical protein
MEHLLHKCLILGVKQPTRLPTISMDGSNIGKRQGLAPFILNKYEEVFTKIRWKQLKRGMPPLKTSPIQSKKSQAMLKRLIKPPRFQIPRSNHNMEEVFGRQSGSIISQPKGQKVIMTNQRGFHQPPNHISSTQAFHLVIITTNEHHPHSKMTTQ